MPFIFLFYYKIILFFNKFSCELKDGPYFFKDNSIYQINDSSTCFDYLQQHLSENEIIIENNGVYYSCLFLKEVFKNV